MLTNAALIVFTLGYVVGRVARRERTRWLAPVSLTGLGLTGLLSMLASEQSSDLAWIVFAGITALGVARLVREARRPRSSTSLV